MTSVFNGFRTDVRKYLSSISGRYYVYILCRPDGQPFYIGKGTNFRALEHEAEARRNHPFGESNPFKCNVIRKIIRNGGDINYCIDSIYEFDKQMQCLEREAELILKHKRLHEGGYLTNLAGGVGNMSGAAPFSLKRHAATLSGEPDNNPERLVLNRFLLSIGPVESVPVKPAGQISRILPSTPHPQPRAPKARCAYALIASASATGLQLAAGVQIPRSFTHQGVTGVLENGVSRDLLKAGMVKLIPATDPAQEKYELNDFQISLLISLVGREHLVERGLI